MSHSPTSLRSSIIAPLVHVLLIGHIEDIKDIKDIEDIEDIEIVPGCSR